MHVYREGPSLETLARSVGALEREAESNGDLAEHVEVLVDVVKRSLPALPKVVWEGDSPKGRYRIVAKVLPGSADGPKGFTVERGTLNATGEWSWNRCGSTTPGPVFKSIMVDYCRLRDAAEHETGLQEAAASLDHLSSKVTRQHAGVGEPEGGEA